MGLDEQVGEVVPSNLGVYVLQKSTIALTMENGNNIPSIPSLAYPMRTQGDLQPC